MQEYFLKFCRLLVVCGKERNKKIAKEGKMSGKYEIKKAKDGKFYFNLKASNGQVILTSQMYKEKSGAKNGIESVQRNSSSSELYEKKESSSDKSFFVLNAKNNQVIGKSQFYASAAAMDNGIESVKKNGATTTIEDLTA
jgi:uncharacterized protein YegP (UPF0339 family)